MVDDGVSPLLRNVQDIYQFTYHGRRHEGRLRHFAASSRSSNINNDSPKFLGESFGGSFELRVSCFVIQLSYVAAHHLDLECRASPCTVGDRRRRRSGWYAWLASLLADVCREWYARMGTKEGAHERGWGICWGFSGHVMLTVLRSSDQETAIPMPVVAVNMQNMDVHVSTC